MPFNIDFTDFTSIAILLLGLLMIAGAIAAVLMRNIISAVIASSLVSLLASVVYLLLGAPDVALTEVAIGSALTTVVFLYAINKVKKDKESEKELNDD